MKNRFPKLSRREFAAAVAAGVAAPALLGGLPVQEQKQEAPKAQTPPPEEENWLERGRKALRGFNLPAETEPAFVFRARWEPPGSE